MFNILWKEKKISSGVFILTARKQGKGYEVECYTSLYIYIYIYYEPVKSIVFGKYVCVWFKYIFKYLGEKSHLCLLCLPEVM